MHALLAHRADEQAVEAAEPTRADDEEIGAFGLVAEHVGGLALAQNRRHRHAGVADVGRRDPFVECRLGELAELVEIDVARRPAAAVDARRGRARR